MKVFFSKAAVIVSFVMIGSLPLIIHLKLSIHLARTSNPFPAFMYGSFLPKALCVSDNISLKEQKIQKARKEWLKARNESDRLLDLYKKEKSDFYKVK